MPPTKSFIKLNNQAISFSENLLYIGVLTDRKLKVNAHGEFCMNRTNIFAYGCKKIFKCITVKLFRICCYLPEFRLSENYPSTRPTTHVDSVIPKN